MHSCIPDSRRTVITIRCEVVNPRTLEPLPSGEPTSLPTMNLSAQPLIQHSSSRSEMLRSITIPAHEPPRQHPRKPLLRGREGALPFLLVRAQRYVARLLGPVAAD